MRSYRVCFLFSTSCSSASIRSGVLLLVSANPHLGKGGVVQYFVDTFISVLKPVDNPINLF